VTWRLASVAEPVPAARPWRDLCTAQRARLGPAIRSWLTGASPANPGPARRALCSHQGSADGGTTPNLRVLAATVAEGSIRRASLDGEEPRDVPRRSLEGSGRRRSVSGAGRHILR